MPSAKELFFCLRSSGQVQGRTMAVDRLSSTKVKGEECGELHRRNNNWQYAACSIAHKQAFWVHAMSHYDGGLRGRASRNRRGRVSRRIARELGFSTNIWTLFYVGKQAG